MQISLTSFVENIDRFIPGAHQGDLFFYPTDTIYGLGALVSPQTIEKIERFKQRQPGKYYSVIAPSFERIEEHFDTNPHLAAERDEKTALYGPITILLRKKDPAFLTEITDTDRVGIRYINHPFQEFVSILKEPFITTSANLSGQPPITSPDKFSYIQKKQLDCIVDAGVLESTPSTILRYGTWEKLR